MLLRREGIFGTMFATYDLRTITGDPNAELSDQQRGVLEYKRDNPEMKDAVLAGPHGVGKTILLFELAKAAVAEEGREKAKVRIFSDNRGAQKLNEYLEDTFKLVWHKNVKVVGQVELNEEFPGDSHVLVSMGSKMEEGEDRLIVVGDEMFDLPPKDLKCFKKNKVLPRYGCHWWHGYL